MYMYSYTANANHVEPIGFPMHPHMWSCPNIIIFPKTSEPSICQLSPRNHFVGGHVHGHQIQVIRQEKCDALEGWAMD